jgi:hypothetical protein
MGSKIILSAGCASTSLQFLSTFLQHSFLKGATFLAGRSAILKARSITIKASRENTFVVMWLV